MQYSNFCPCSNQTLSSCSLTRLLTRWLWRTRNKIIRRFKDLDAPMIFGAESDCYTLMYPYFNLDNNFCDNDNCFPRHGALPSSLNSGQWTAKARNLKRVLSHYILLGWGWYGRSLSRNISVREGAYADDRCLEPNAWLSSGTVPGYRGAYRTS